MCEGVAGMCLVVADIDGNALPAQGSGVVAPVVRVISVLAGNLLCSFKKSKHNQRSGVF
jgi:hypothetical protein